MPRPRRLGAVIAGALVLLPGTLAGTQPGTLARPAAQAVQAAEEPAAAAVCDPSVLATSDRATEDQWAQVDEAVTAASRMHLAQAHRISRGERQTVAVIDSGVGTGLGIDVRTERLWDLGGPLASGHGTLVAGIIAGPQGVAPEASILSVRVYDTAFPDRSRGQRGVDSAGIAAGLQLVAQLHEQNPVGVVNVSLSVPRDDPALRAAVERLQWLGVVVVAAAGNSRMGEDDVEGTPDSDVASYPADYPGVVGVSAVGPDAGVDLRPHVAPNADTDVAAPTVGARSVNLNGQECVVADEIATSYAAAQVSGALALLRAHRPDENGAQAVARLLHTAEGSPRGEHPWLGAGVVQPADALAHELSPALDGSLPRTEEGVPLDAQAPPPPEYVDSFGPSRTLLMWSALGAGGLLVLAMVLRPLVRRRA